MPRIYKNFRLSTFEYDTTGRDSVAVFKVLTVYVEQVILDVFFELKFPLWVPA